MTTIEVSTDTLQVNRLAADITALGRAPELLWSWLDHALLFFYDIETQPGARLDGTLELRGRLCADIGWDEILFDGQFHDHLPYLSRCACCIVRTNGSAREVSSCGWDGGREYLELLRRKFLQRMHVVLVAKNAHLYVQAEMISVLPEQGCIVVQIVKVVDKCTNAIWVFLGQVNQTVPFFLTGRQRKVYVCGHIRRYLEGVCARSFQHS